MAIKKHIPNFITLLNLFFGCISIMSIVRDDLWAASIFIFVAAFFDLLDGMAARLLNAVSAIGKELDSLADVVSFGVAPGFILWKVLEQNLDTDLFYLSYLAFLIPLFSALRLANFNIDTRQSDKFLGIPVPANAILIASFPLIVEQNLSGFAWLTELVQKPWFLMAYIALFSFLLVSEFPLLAFKFKSLKWKENALRYIFIGVSMIAVLLFHFVALPMIIVLYFALSVIDRKTNVST
jgi:CDP-diacylglycerol---serine O-phosphatidyltransferase